MGRLRTLLNLVILAIGAWIAWHEYHHPPETKPRPSPEPAPSPQAAAPASSPKAPPPTAPVPPPERDVTTAQPSATAAPTAPAVDTGAAESVADSAAARIGELTEEPAVPENAVRGNGTRDCPEAYPIKGNATSRIYHEPGRPSYDRTIPEFCFATVEAAEAAGFRAPRH